ncbi:hypothetical protein BGX34_009946 [Mortierella sp. NVP85]|nr:hypothetical protein BGX34_009946 [Mortierella sp. NVP85]
MDDDFLSDYQRGLDSPMSDISESALIGKDTQYSYTQTGMVTKGLFAQGLENHDCNMVVESPEQASTPLLEPLRDVEQLDVKHHSTLPSSIQEQLDFLLDREHLDDPRALMARPIPDEEKKSKMSKLLTRAASNGDLDRVADVLDNFSEWVDINLHDEDGSTPLIYASCFGHTRAVSMLLDGGACVDERDSFGWTALVWATNNKHEEIVRLLLNHGASPKAQTSKGRTVADFLRHDPNDTSKIAKIFKEPTKRVHTSSQSSRVLLQDIHRADRELMTEEERQHRPQADFNGIAELDAEMTENFDAKSLFDQTEAEPEDEDDEEEGVFDWNNCKIDQMLVFSSADIPQLVKTIITTMEPKLSRPYKPIPAYVLFLAARFASNFGTSDLLDELLDASIEAIQSVTKSHPEDVTLSTFWISNTSSLLHFLRKDAGLRSVSEQYEGRLEILLRDMAQIVILDAQKKMEPVLETAMLENVTIDGLKETKYKTDWAFSIWRGIERGRRSIRRNKRASAPPPFTPCDPVISRQSSRPSLHIPRSTSPKSTGPTPEALTSTLSSLLQLLRSFDIHPEIIHYMVAQLLYYIGCEIFNRMIEGRQYMSRSQALQTRLNVSMLEDWLRNHQLPSRLAEQMGPLVQLLQLLQVLSQQKDLATWIETRKKVHLLNPTQIKHVVNTYRYDVDEQRLPAEVTKYVLQVVADTEKVRRQSLERKASDSSFSMSVVSSRRNSGSRSYASSMYSRDEGELCETSSIKSKSGTIVSEVEQQEQDEMALSCTTKNSTIWILFQIPSNLATRDGGVEKEFFPQVPEDVMSLLDSQVYSRSF